MCLIGKVNTSCIGLGKMSIVHFFVLEKQVLSCGCGLSEKSDTKEDLILDLYYLFATIFFFKGLLLNF